MSTSYLVNIILSVNKDDKWEANIDLYKVVSGKGNRLHNIIEIFDNYTETWDSFEKKFVQKINTALNSNLSKITWVTNPRDTDWNKYPAERYADGKYISIGVIGAIANAYYFRGTVS